MKNQSAFFYVLVLIFLLSCSKKEEKVIDKAKMEKILMDIHLTEAFVQSEPMFNEDTAEATFFAEKKEIFKRHGVDSALFYSSYQYYLNHLEEMEMIYTALVDSLKSKETTLEIGREIDSSAFKMNKKITDTLLLELERKKIK